MEAKDLDRENELLGVLPIKGQGKVLNHRLQRFGTYISKPIGAHARRLQQACCWKWRLQPMNSDISPNNIKCYVKFYCCAT